MANALEMKDICIGFSGVQVLKNVSLTVREGTVHGLVGENGAGKSTLIKILSGAYRSDSGTIRVFDEQLDPKTITPQKMIAKRGRCDLSGIYADRKYDCGREYFPGEPAAK